MMTIILIIYYKYIAIISTERADILTNGTTEDHWCKQHPANVHA